MSPDMPPLSAPLYFRWLMEVGPTEIGGMTAVPIGWDAIRNWSVLTRTPLRSWEARLLRRLSAEYLKGLRDGEKMDCPAPYAGEVTEDRRKAVENQIDRLFRGPD